MSSQNKAPEYMLLFRGNDWYNGLSPEEMQKVAGQWMAWFERLTAQGKAIAGSPLEKEGRMVSAISPAQYKLGPKTVRTNDVSSQFPVRCPARYAASS